MTFTNKWKRDIKTLEEEIAVLNSTDQDESGLDSIFTIIPYKEEEFSIYYYPDTKELTVIIHEAPVQDNIDNAMHLIKQFDETEDFTEEDISVVLPSYLSSGN